MAGSIKKGIFFANSLSKQRDVCSRGEGSLEIVGQNHCCLREAVKKLFFKLPRPIRVEGRLKKPGHQEKSSKEKFSEKMWPLSSRVVSP